MQWLPVENRLGVGRKKIFQFIPKGTFYWMPNGQVLKFSQRGGQRVYLIYMTTLSSQFYIKTILKFGGLTSSVTQFSWAVSWKGCSMASPLLICVTEEMVAFNQGRWEAMYLRGVSFSSNSVFFLHSFPFLYYVWIQIIYHRCCMRFRSVSSFWNARMIKLTICLYSSSQDVKDSQTRLFAWKIHGLNRIKHLKTKNSSERLFCLMSWMLIQQIIL